MPDAFLLTRFLLQFDEHPEDLLTDISAAAFTPDGSIWVGSDELVGIERLSPMPDKPGVYAQHQRFLLGKLIDLFNPEDEIDIEGMDYSEGYLWVTGSHSTKRKKVKGKKTKKDLERLATITTDANRFILAKIPIINGEPVKSYVSADGKGERLHSACLQKTDGGNVLIEALKTDEHLQPFLATNIPSKDNGLDVEGLAVYGNRVFLGLRGPVLRGQAVIIEIEVQSKDEAGVLTLKPLDNERLYRKHFLDLNGLGIRELCLQGKDLIILAGPTMDLEGVMEVFRWHEAVECQKDSVHSQGDELKKLFTLPFTISSDHAEGLALHSTFGDESLVVVYDSPNPNRIPTSDSIFIDVFRLDK